MSEAKGLHRQLSDPRFDADHYNMGGSPPAAGRAARNLAPSMKLCRDRLWL